MVRVSRLRKRKHIQDAALLGHKGQCLGCVDDSAGPGTDGANTATYPPGVQLITTSPAITTVLARQLSLIFYTALLATGHRAL